MTREVAWIIGSPQREPLDDAGWRNLLAITDRTLCTPLLRDREGLADWVREEVELRIAKIAQRRATLLSTYAEAASALKECGVEFVLLKGFTHEVDAGVDPHMRAQSDIDILCHPRNIAAGLAALKAGGFYPHGGELSDNHAPPMLKPHSWRWRGDYFDPAHPVTVELHHSIWSQSRDRIETPGTEAFWDRRVRMQAAAMSVPALQVQDRLCMAALHLLRHALWNNVRPTHAWELAVMLSKRSEDFWREWAALHPPRLRALQAVAFRFAAVWFGNGEIPLAAQPAWSALPPRVHRWFETSAFSPLDDLTRPNKDVVWLHLALLPNFADRLAVARRRFFPLRAPSAEEAPGAYLSHLAQRSIYHARALAGTVWTRSKTPHTLD